MNWAKLATDLIAPFEGCHTVKKGLVYPYLDKLAKPNLWTRGYGMTEGITENTPPITKEQAKQELEAAVYRYGLRCAKFAPALLDRPHCLAAVTSWAYNCGIGAFQRSRLCKAINEGRWDDAVELIKKPNTAGGVVYAGLTKRRLAESTMFAKGVE